MIVLNLKLNHIYGFEDFEINFTYPKKIVNSIIPEEYLTDRPRFRYKKAIVLMGSNATGKTSLGRTLLEIFRYIQTENEQRLSEIVQGNEVGNVQIDFVNEGFQLHRLTLIIDKTKQSVERKYETCKILSSDTYESCAGKLIDRTENVAAPGALSKAAGQLRYRFEYSEIEHKLNVDEIDQQTLLTTLCAVIGTLDPTLRNISISKELKNSFVIRRKNEEIIIQEGKLLNREALSSGTIEGIDIAVFLASMLTGKGCFYYCDEHFSFIQSDIEQRIFGLMLCRLKGNEQLIFTTHNTDMLDLNLPKHSFAFLRKTEEDGDYHINVTYASDILKRNTDSVRNAVENDMFQSLPDDSLLDELEAGDE